MAAGLDHGKAGWTRGRGAGSRDHRLPRGGRLGSALTESALSQIVLQKSKVAPARSFDETLKHEAIDDSDNLSRATEVAYEFSV